MSKIIKENSFAEVMAEAKKNKAKRMKQTNTKSRIKSGESYPTTILDVTEDGNKVTIVAKFWVSLEGVTKEIFFDIQKQDFRIEAIADQADVDCLVDMISCHYETLFKINKKGYKEWEIIGELDDEEVADYLEDLSKATKNKKRKAVNLLDNDETEGDYAESDLVV